MSTTTFGCDEFARHDSANLQLHQRIAKKISNLVCAVRHRTEMRQLLAGDPRLLEDIGISQSDVLSAMSRSVLQDPTQETGERVDRRHAAWRRLYK